METLPIKEIAQLGGMAVVALACMYVLFSFIKEHIKEIESSRKERLETYNWFTGYVTENNHEQTDRFKEHTKALVDVTVESTKAMDNVAKNIAVNTEVTKKSLELLERLYDKIRDK